MKELKTFIDYQWKFRNGKRASKFAHVYHAIDSSLPWSAQKKGCFNRPFKTEQEAGEFVAKQLGATIWAVTFPDWSESMRSTPMPDPVVKKPKPKKQKMACRPRRLVVRFVKRPDIGEVLHSGRALISGVGEQSSGGYEEMQTRGVM